MASPTGFTRLTRKDLRAFDARCQDVILSAMERGGVGRISSKGHAILRSPNGQTMSVSRNTAAGNRSFQNMESDYNRCFGDLPVVDERTDGGLALAPALPDIAQRDPDLECPLEGCEAVFVTEGARYDHVEKKHFRCPEPGCPKVYDDKRKATGHYNLAHRRVGHEGGTYPCPVRGCGFVAKTPGGLGGHKRQRHPAAKAPVAKKAAPKQKAAPLDEALKVEAEHYEGVRAQEVLDEVSRLVAPTLVAQLEAAHARIAELEGKLARIRKDLS